MKWIIIILMAIVMISVANAAYDICGDLPEIKTNCQMITPSNIQCSNFTYSIYDVNSTLVDSGQLTSLNSSVYYFNFTQNVGHYYIKLCDGGIREVFVNEDFNSGYYLYVVATIMFIFLIVLGYYIKSVIPLTLSGFLLMLIGINLFFNGFPNLTSTFLINTMTIIFIGLGMILAIAPNVDYLEELF